MLNRLFLVAILTAMLCVPGLANAGPFILGIDYSNLTRQSQDRRHKALDAIHATGVLWFRDTASETNTTPQGMASLIDETSYAKSIGLKVLLNLLPANEDYLNNNAGAPQNSCGWISRPLSGIDPAKFTQRLTNQLTALKAAHVDIDAFEIGNEDNNNCYNADVPYGHVASDQEVALVVRGYAKFLGLAAQVIKQPAFYPNARIITFGISHPSQKWDRPPRNIYQPARIIAALRNVDGVNYLDNNKYHVDGYGTHYYASPNDIKSSLQNEVKEDISYLGTDKPLWVTEWSFLDAPKNFPNKNGQTLGQGVQEFMNALASMRPQASFGPIMFYDYEWIEQVPEVGTVLSNAAR